MFAYQHRICIYPSAAEIKQETADGGSDADAELSDADADLSEDAGDDEATEETGKTGMADVLAKILNKKTPTKGVILAKAKTDRQLQYAKRQQLIKEEEEAPKKKKKAADDDDEVISNRRSYQEEREKLHKV